MGGASARLAWAAEMAAPQPGERVLEVGCGHGVLLSLIAERLAGGSVLGLDRSPTMTAAALRRNREDVAAGRVAVQTAELAAADLPAEAFDLVVAVHVGAFWRSPAEDFGVVRRVLAPGGRFVLVDQPLTPGAADGRATRIAALAAPYRLAVTGVHTGDTPPRPSIAIGLCVAR
ncbi:class I SAM-dependent methyltransferase [Modestobacter sp. I12A-02662]|uniref:class I SAM-dependent methyltransferase n=1 Tax=Modestobacter sp. I12A-02662 TaxID=1730496 RepID=UPI0034DFB35E